VVICTLSQFESFIVVEIASLGVFCSAGSKLLLVCRYGGADQVQLDSRSEGP